MMKLNINNIEFEVDDSTQPEFWDCLNQAKWEPDTFKIIDSFVFENSIVLDIGCWIGPLSLYMAGKGAEVFSIDPDPIAFKEFIVNLNLNPVLKQNIHPFNIAITQDSRSVKLFARSGYGNSSTSIIHRIRDAKRVAVCEGLSFNEFINRTSLNRVEFIKWTLRAANLK